MVKKFHLLKMLEYSKNIARTNAPAYFDEETFFYRNIDLGSTVKNFLVTDEVAN